MKNRIEELDSVRGLAAFSVFMTHLPLVSLAFSPILIHALRLTGITNGHGAVMLFFVLSGFVLSPPFLKDDKPDYFQYLVKRFFRIYVPYLVAIVVSMVLSQQFLNININSDLDKWNTQVNTNLIIEHIYLLGNIHSDAFDDVIWSLIHELRISLIFPFVVIFLSRKGLKFNILICFILSGISIMNSILNLQVSKGYFITYFDSLHYLSFFVFGCLIAKNKVQIINFYRRLTILKKIFLLLASFIAYNFSHIIFILPYIKIVSAFYLPVVEYFMAIGAIGFLIIAMGSIRISKILLFKPIAFLGKISFSLYLLHKPILLATTYLLNKTVSLWLICIIAFILTLLISYIAWKFVEDPCMRLGKYITIRINNVQIKKIKTIKEVANNQ